MQLGVRGQTGKNLNTARKKVSNRVEAAVPPSVTRAASSTALQPRSRARNRQIRCVDVPRRRRGTAGSLPLSMNCTDCAVTVAVFANLLGAGLSLMEVEREPRNLKVNDVKLIGNKIFSSMFDYHAIAMRGLDSSAQVFDATLQPDWDVTAAGEDFKLTQGRGRGPKADTGGAGYLQRLLEPGQSQWDDSLWSLMRCRTSRCLLEGRWVDHDHTSAAGASLAGHPTTADPRRTNRKAAIPRRLTRRPTDHSCGQAARSAHL